MSLRWIKSKRCGKVHVLRTSSTSHKVRIALGVWGVIHTLKLAVRWHPSFGRWIEVNAGDSRRRKFIGYFCGPDASAGPDIKDVLCRTLKRTLEQRILSLEVQEVTDDVAGVHTLKLMRKLEK